MIRMLWFGLAGCAGSDDWQVQEAPSDAVHAATYANVCFTDTWSCAGGTQGLRYVMAFAGAFAGDDDILLDPGTYHLTAAGGGDVPVPGGNGSITIQGAGKDVTFISANLADRAFDVLAGAKLILRDLTIIDAQTGDNGGAVRVTNGELVLSNVEIRGGQADRGGAIAAFASIVDISYSELIDNQAIFDGGALYADTISEITLSYSQIQDNRSLMGSGGGVYASDTFVASTSFRGNEAQLDGGGLRAGPLQWVTGEVENNQAARNGGGVYIIGLSASSDLTSLQVTDNHAGNHGGGLFIQNGEVVFFKGGVQDNDAALDGGGIFNRGELTLSLSGVDHNDSLRNGAGIFNGLVGTLVVADGTNVDFNVSQADGAGIYNLGDATVSSSASVSNNTAMGAGGGIFNNGDLACVGCWLNDNVAARGGGLDNQSLGVALMSASCQIRRNQVGAGIGGGVANRGGTVSINTCDTSFNVAARGAGVFSTPAGPTLGAVGILQGQVNDNVASLNGAGVHVSGSLLNVEQVDIARNVSSKNGGGIFAFDPAAGSAVRDSTLDRNVASDSGGGIFFTASDGNTLITGSTLSRNVGTNGGGLYLALAGTSEFEMVNSTVSGNDASLRGGGVFIDTDETAALLLRHCTIARNDATVEGGGTHVAASGAPVQLEANLLTENTSPAGNDCSAGAGATYSSLDYNVIVDACSSGAICPGLSETVPGSDLLGGTCPGAAGANAYTFILEPLQNNGGPTETHFFSINTPPVDRAPNPPTFDQRGDDRPGCANDIGDAGAVELQCMVFP